MGLLKAIGVVDPKASKDCDLDFFSKKFGVLLRCFGIFDPHFIQWNCFFYYGFDKSLNWASFRANIRRLYANLCSDAKDILSMTWQNPFECQDLASLGLMRALMSALYILVAFGQQATPQSMNF